MGKVNIKGIPELEKNIEKTFDKVVRSQQMKNEIGQFTVGRIQAEARRARPLNKQRAFPNLKDSTVNIRESRANFNTTHPTFKPSRSNLTFTGQLIDAIVYGLLDKGRIQIEVADTFRDPVITASGDLEGGNTNKEVDADLRRRGFVLFSKAGIDSEPRILRRINNIAKKFVRRAIKVNFGS